MFLYSTGNINSIAESLKIWSILILFGFRNFALAYLLKCIRNPQINTHSAFTVIHRDVQSGDRLEPADVHVLSWGQIRWHSAFLFQLSDYKPALFPFHGLNRAMLFSLSLFLFYVGEFPI